jgi:hypothetical protein
VHDIAYESETQLVAGTVPVLALMGYVVSVIVPCAVPHLAGAIVAQADLGIGAAGVAPIRELIGKLADAEEEASAGIPAILVDPVRRPHRDMGTVIEAWAVELPADEPHVFEVITLGHPDIGEGHALDKPVLDIRDELLLFRPVGPGVEFCLIWEIGGRYASLVRRLISLGRLQSLL